MRKWVAVVVLLILSLFVLWWLFLRPVSVTELISRNTVAYSTAVNQIKNSDELCIVYLFNNIKDPIRQNVAQCGVDFAYTYTAITKNPVRVYGIENGQCTTLEGVKNEQDCIREVMFRNCYVIVVNGSDSLNTETFNNLMYVEVGREYDDYDCALRVNGKLPFEIVNTSVNT